MLLPIIMIVICLVGGGVAYYFILRDKTPVSKICLQIF